MIAQTQGIVGVITGAVAASMAGLALNWTSPLLSWLAAAGALLLTVAVLFAYWQRSLAEIQAAMRPLSSTPADELGAPF
jgi:protein-S-isoprenylcysteine O-methyltransferase Ste14